jgi:predicted metal-dependent hydrolase
LSSAVTEVSSAVTEVGPGIQLSLFGFDASVPVASAPSAEPAAVGFQLFFVRHRKARRYWIRVVDDGRVRVTIPRGGSKRDALAFVERERAWIDNERRLHSERQARREAQRGADGQQPLRHRPPPCDLLARAKRELPARLLELAATLALTVNKVSVRNQKSLWGSCSRTGHISLNWRLVRMPDAVRDYVMIHELMHLKRMDHSRKFWRLVAAACPDYRELRRQLRGMVICS